jgi:hypothetical protein
MQPKNRIKKPIVFYGKKAYRVANIMRKKQPTKKEPDYSNKKYAEGQD